MTMEVKKQKWDIDEAESIYWICSEAAIAMTYGMRKVYGFGFNRNVVIFRANEPFKWCTLASELEKIGYLCFKKFKNKKFRLNIEKQYQALKEKIDLTIKDYQSSDVSSLTVDRLFEYLEIFTENYKENFSIGFFAEPFDFVFPQIFQKTFKSWQLSKNDLADLAAISKPSYLNLESRDLIKIAIKKISGKDIKVDLYKHCKKYEWLMTGHDGKKVINKNFFKLRIGQYGSNINNLKKEFKHLYNYSKAIESRKEKIIKDHNLSKSAVNIIRLIDDVGPWHDIRKELFVKTIYYSDDIRQELGKRFGYSLNDLQFFTAAEIIKLIKNKKITPLEIKKRKEFIYFDFNFKNKKPRILKGKNNIKKIPKEFIFTHKKQNKIFGMVASSGKAIGRARIIFGVSGFSKMKNGDILVTGMTRPEMLPIMKKAKAIVTDEGGLTCHAAIVARELKIPCIIGTKNATKIISDGEIIEVDAVNGFVNKLYVKKS